MMVCCLLGTTAAQALESVALQLKWTHAFQFAGYYVAIEKGYYRQAGLEVRLLEAQPGTDPVKTVLSGKAEFGVGNSNLLLERQAGAPVVALAVIFQHSPLVLMAHQTKAVQSVHDLKGKRVMFETQSAELFAYLRQEGLEAKDIQVMRHSFNTRDLIEGRVDAMTAYSTNELFELNQAGFAYQMYSPREVAIDFYGDNLFTTEQQIKAHPARVAAFRAASLNGWQYAMAHPDEVIDLILTHYATQHSRAFYQFEAQQMAPLLQSSLIEVGYMNPGRWRHIANTYASLGLLPANISLDGFLYDTTPTPSVWSPYLGGALALLLCISMLASYILWANRRLAASLASQRLAQQALTESQQLYQSILQASPDAVVVSDLQGSIRHVSPVAVSMLGCETEDQLLGRNVAEFRDPADSERATANIAAMFEGVYNGAEDYRLIRLDGSTLDTEINAEIVRDAQGQPSGLIFVVRDISERKKTEQRIRHMAQHDPLTGLANRALFSDRLQRAIANAVRDKTGLALLFIDLDKFKPVNDTYGHAVGDRLLQEVARRMLQCVRDSDTVARIGGDELVVLLRGACGIPNTLVVAEKIRSSLERPFQLDGHELLISCSVGVALFPEHGQDEITLAKHADLAMYQAKEHGRNQVCLFQPWQDD
ncbi:ABC transporter substrate-binding protein [Rhodoferax sp.]|uniref:ABC transporter substrate-binding protein n=1 Tax=Rhodoferax sp. TaxID=50421 RepID=UPI00284AFB5A|nr:ABC transporter substrate-binding protein [Rhodoferax sp.]MDR3371016.1 ABC transporter substrate-binding protein [Rhodoferax sp.]